MRPGRDPLLLLEQLVARIEPTGHNVSAWLLEHLPTARAWLGVTEPEVLALATLPDEILRFYLGPALHEHRQARKRQQEVHRRVDQEDLAAELARRAQWHHQRAFLDASLLFGPLLVGPHTVVRFVSDLFEVEVERRRLREAGVVLGQRADLQVYLDAQGLHLRWNQGRGRLNFHPQRRHRVEDEVRVIALPPIAFHALAAE